MQRSAAQATHTVARDLAISAVASDAAFVSELIADVSQSLHTAPSWAADVATEPDGEPQTPFAADTSRVVVVLYHHLWLHDEAAQRDTPLLRERLDASTDAVCVLSLDETPVPRWLRKAARYDLTQGGRNGMAEFVVDAVSTAGGDVSASAQPQVAADSQVPWADAPRAFLSQQRAQSTLRHELTALAEQLEAAVDRARALQPDRLFEMRIVPQRMIARLGDVAISFSWLAGRSASVAEGSLLAIGWRGIPADVRGIAALQSATVIHEQSYVADGDAPDAWRWRSVNPVAHPYSSANLVDEWMARASIAASPLPNC